MKARQQARIGKQAHVATHRLQRDPEMLGQRLDRDAAELAHFFDQTNLARVELHRSRI